MESFDASLLRILGGNVFVLGDFIARRLQFFFQLSNFGFDFLASLDYVLQGLDFLILDWKERRFVN